MNRPALVVPVVVALALASGVAVRAADPPPAGGATFERGPDLDVTRQGATYALLADGRLVVFGGQTEGWTVLDTAEVLETDSLSGAQSWRVLQMNQTHGQGMGAWLADGRFLLMGGTGDGGAWPGHTGAELYDPSNDSFTVTGPMTYGRAASGAARLADGRVLVIGTWFGENEGSAFGDLYDPVAGTFSATGALNHSRASCLVLPCDDGTAVVFGGMTPDVSAVVDPVESFDPVSRVFTVIANSILPGDPGWTITANAGMYQHPLEDHNRLADGRTLLMLGRYDGPYQYRLVAFDPATKQFDPIGSATTLHDSTGGWYLQPVADAAGTRAMLVNIHPDPGSVNLVQFESVDVATGAVTRPTTWFDVGPVARYEGGGIVRDALGRLALIGGRNQANPGNDSSTKETLFVAPVGLVPPTPPAAPTGLMAVPTSGRSVQLTWTDASDDEDAFRVERAPAGGTFVFVRDTAADATSFEDTGLSPATEYVYRVRATNAAGDSDFTPDATTKTPGGKLSVPGRLAFGRVKAGKAKTLRLTVKNLSKADPLWFAMETDGVGYSVVTVPPSATLAPRKSLRVQIRFAPSVRGKHAGFLDVTTSDPVTEEKAVKLSGSGR